MKKYRCKICGYIYDDAKEKVKFEDLPENWKCPWCGAPKSMFEEIKETENVVITDEIEEENKLEFDDDSLREINQEEMAYICSNLAKSCEKQYLDEEKELFQELANYYEKQISNKTGNLQDITLSLEKDLQNLDEAMKIANKYNDSGSKRVITWATKTTNILNVILNNYQNKGIEYVKNTKIWVCEICGFIYIGDEPPKVCPVCKVPNIKILEVK